MISINITLSCEEAQRQTKRRARIITTHEGKFVSVEDIRRALQDPIFINYCALMLKVGEEINASPLQSLQQAIGCAVFTLAGEQPKMEAP